MNDMAKTTLKILGYLFTLLVLGFTGYQTWSLLYEVSNNPIVAGLGLALFEGSMIYWWLAFQKEAEGLPQMALSLLVALFGLLLVGGATALHLGAVGADILGSETPARLVTLAAIINLVAKFAMPLLHPDVMKTTYRKALTGKVMSQTFAQFETKVKDIATQLAEDVAEDWKEEMRREILASHLLRPQGKLTAVSGGSEETPPLPHPKTAVPEPVVVSANGEVTGDPLEGRSPFGGRKKGM